MPHPSASWLCGVGSKHRDSQDRLRPGRKGSGRTGGQARRDRQERREGRDRQERREGRDRQESEKRRNRQEGLDRRERWKVKTSLKGKREPSPVSLSGAYSPFRRSR